jgi:CelD/BcsL family acetyltransferase involved in cellulose biosynthesis
MYSIDVIGSIQELDAIENEWRKLTADGGGEGIGLSFDYNQLWWKHFNSGDSLLVLLARDGSDLVGIAPLKMSKIRWHSVEANKVSFIGPRYLTYDFIAKEGMKRDVTRSYITYLKNETDFDYIELCSLLSESATIANVRDLSRELRLAHSSTVRGDTLSILFEGTWDSFNRAKGSHFRKRQHEAQRLLPTLGESRIVRTRFARDPDDIARRVQELMDRSWKAERAKNSAGFLADYVRRLNSNAELDLFEMLVRDRVIAFWLLARQRGIAYAMFTAYDEDYSDYSPGFTLLDRVVRELFSENGIIRELDFLNDLPYLRRWANSVHPRQSVTLYSNRVSSQFIRLGRRPLHWNWSKG